MATTYIEVYPTCDIHLLDGGSPMSVTLRGLLGAGLSGTLTVEGYENDAKVAAPSFVSVSVAGATVTVSPTSVGECFLKLVYMEFDGMGNMEAHLHEWLRVRVHEEMTALWSGNNRATVHEGADNYVLTVYAKFKDGTKRDVSSHPYIDFESESTAVVEVDGQGRPTGKRRGGITRVKVSHGGMEKFVTVEVIDPITEPKEIVEQIYGSGNPDENHNILFLAEGFTEDQKEDFKGIALTAATQLFNFAKFSPYHLLKDSFSVWTAFTASNEEGAIVGCPVNEDGYPIPEEVERLKPDPDYYGFNGLITLVGLPEDDSPETVSDAKTGWADKPDFNKSDLKEKVFNEWKKMKIYSHLQARDNYFGVELGSRFGDRWSMSMQTDYPNQWYNPVGPVRAFDIDRRRMPANWSYTSQIDDFLRSLKRIEGAGAAGYDIGERWAEGGDDYGMVCVLVNEEHFGGTNFGFFFVASTGIARKYDLLPAGRHGDDHLPQINLNNFFRISPVLREIRETLAHELAHGLELLDEYEGYDDPEHASLPSDGSSFANGKQAGIEKAPNLDHHYRLEIVNGNPQIDPAEISWNLHRIASASVLYTNADYLPGDNSYVVTLAPGEGAKWTQAWNEGKAVYLWNGKFRGNGFDRMGGLTIREEPLANVPLILDGGDPAHAVAFKKGSLVYLPHYDDDGEPKGVIDGPVYERMTNTGRPLYEKDASDCSVPELDEAYPGSIPGYRMPRNQADVIGLYEGGGSWNCKVYRPAGHCVMRSERYWADEWFRLFGFRLFPLDRDVREAGQFCYVCKFHMVTRLDPTKHELLDKEYPEGR